MHIGPHGGGGDVAAGGNDGGGNDGGDGNGGDDGGGNDGGGNVMVIALLYYYFVEFRWPYDK